MHGTLRERLEALRDRRVCREELWNLTNGDHWLTVLPLVLARQPVGTPESRKLALARFGMLPRNLDTEIANLRRGLQEKYSTPKLIVERTIRQVDGLLSQPEETSPFFNPARRDTTAEFVSQWRALLTGQIKPAVIRYRNFLRDEYGPAARETPGISAHPNGAACFLALVRDYTSLPATAEELKIRYRRDLEEQVKAADAAATAAGGSDARKHVQDLVARNTARFDSRDEVLPAAEALVKRLEDGLPKLFSRVPPQTVTVRLTPAFREESAAFGFYAGKGVLEINPRHAMQPGARIRLEMMVFHEVGHHVQASLTAGRGEIHRALARLRQPVFNEGWGDYVVQLAAEQGLLSADGAAVFQYANVESAAGSVAQVGLHLEGWSRDQAIAFLARHGVRSADEIATAVDRRIATPADTLAYSAGRIRILELRARARQALGSGFDLREFHDRVLEYGSVTLPMLTEMIDRWIASKRKP